LASKSEITAERMPGEKKITNATMKTHVRDIVSFRKGYLQYIV